LEKKQRYSAAWQQFLAGRRAILAAYDRALGHAREQPVSVHHGIVGEAAVRDWLTSFLPRRYGVASGYIRNQGLPKPYQTRHFDVIIYDQIEAPILWIEENKDKSESGRMRIIPAEFVQAVLEVKATFSARTVRESAAKLRELQPLMQQPAVPSPRYPRCLPDSMTLAMLFFELRGSNQFDREALNILAGLEFQRFFYGSLILRGEGLDPDDTALIQKYRSDAPTPEVWAAAGLLHGFAKTGTTESDRGRHGVMLMWSDVNFSKFAFDLLACLDGTYQPGILSSFHGLEIQGQL
jgi:hypothetical protein